MSKFIENDKSVNFSGNDYLGKEVQLSNFSGKKVLLTFLRGTSCPFCLGRIKELVKRHEELKKNGIEVIAIIAAKQEDVARYSTKNSAPFPIIPDPEQEIFKKYGISTSNFILMKAMMRPMLMMKAMMQNFNGMTFLFEPSLLPADFFIGENQRIEKLKYGTFLGDHLSLKDILAS